MTKGHPERSEGSIFTKEKICGCQKMRKKHCFFTIASLLLGKFQFKLKILGTKEYILALATEA